MKVIYAKRNGRPGRQQKAFWQVAFKFTLTSALPRCLSNKINNSLWSKRSHQAKLDAPFSFVVCRGMLTHYGKCLCLGELSPVTLIGGVEEEASLMEWKGHVRWSGGVAIVSQARPSHSVVFSSFRINTQGEGLANCLCPFGSMIA